MKMVRKNSKRKMTRKTRRMNKKKNTEPRLLEIGGPNSITQDRSVENVQNETERTVKTAVGIVSGQRSSYRNKRRRRSESGDGPREMWN